MKFISSLHLEIGEMMHEDSEFGNFEDEKEKNLVTQ